MRKIEKGRVSLPFLVRTTKSIDGVDKNRHRGN